MTLMLALFGCGSPDPSPRPSPVPAEPSIYTRIDGLRMAVGRAAQSDERTCDAIEKAIALAPVVEEALINGADEQRIREHTNGLSLQRPVTPDWPELALAVGPGTTSTALISVGGLSGSLKDGCIDVESLRRWVGRGPTMKKSAPCVQEVLIPVWRSEVERLISTPCLCAVPERDFITGMANATTRMGLDDTTTLLRAWPQSDRWKSCPEGPSKNK